MRRGVLAAVFVWFSVGAAMAGTPVIPTTTLSIETGNNTSAAATFVRQSNGNAGAGNVSKVPIRKALYLDANTKIYAHFMPWFGGTNHMSVGYRSDDANQVARQVADMASRGIQGAIIDWYGPNFTRENTTTQLIMREAERTPGFEFAVTEDVGALRSCMATVGCDVTGRLIEHLNYAVQNYAGSPAYMRVNGRPVIFFFGLETLAVDWNRVRASVAGEPLYIHRNTGGFTKTQTNGAYSWVAPETVTLADPMGLGYLDYWYSKAREYSALLPWASAYPGFDDSLAAWTQQRVVGQQCGQTWLTTLARAGRYYSGAQQLPAIQLVTWNDYEEGSEIESGIENCVTVAAQVSGNRLAWEITGSESTVDHFEVFVSADGQNLMRLAEVAASARVLELWPYQLEGGHYTLYVKAVGKPSLTNKMSNGAAWQMTPTVARIVSPAAAATVSSPMRVVAGGESGAGVSRVQVLVDGVVRHESGNAAVDVELAVAAGARVVSVVVTDAAGASVTQSVNVMVAEAAPEVVFSSPVNGASYSGLLQVKAAAKSSRPVVAMAVYADDRLVTKVNAAQVDVTLNLALGWRRIVAQFWDSSGAVTKGEVRVQMVARRASSASGSGSDPIRLEGADSTDAAPIRITRPTRLRR